MEKSEWDYFQISPHIDIKLLPQEGQPHIFEPVAFVCAVEQLHPYLSCKCASDTLLCASTKCICGSQRL